MANPVYKREDGTWWYWEESWCDENGPYATEAEALKECTRYCAVVLEGDRTLDRSSIIRKGMWLRSLTDSKNYKRNTAMRVASCHPHNDYFVLEYGIGLYCYINKAICTDFTIISGW